METPRRDFDKEAAGWDENAARVKLAGDLVEAILSHVPLSATDAVLDFGCGTGLVALRLAETVRSVTGMDTSRGMLDVCATKCRNLGLDNVTLLQLEGDTGPHAHSGRYDVIVSCMTLHHVEDTAALLAGLTALLAPGGWLCLADLDLEGGRFHGDNTGVYHFGFERSALREILAGLGFRDITDCTAAVVRGFPVFLITGRL